MDRGRADSGWCPRLAVLVVLNKSFRGRSLLVDSEVGVIGRNVLNRVRLHLDGPSLHREEWAPRGTKA